MSDRLKFERFLWFHGRIKAERYPNASHLAEEFEISPRTAQRDIEFIRHRLEAFTATQTAEKSNDQRVSEIKTC